MGTAVRVENWGVHAPGLCREDFHICGDVFGHPNFVDGTRQLCLSTVHEINGREIVCAARTYVLGAIHPEYLEICRTGWNPQHPPEWRGPAFPNATEESVLERMAVEFRKYKEKHA